MIPFFEEPNIHKELLKKLEQPLLKENGFLPLLHHQKPAPLEPQHFSLVLSDTITTKFFMLKGEANYAIASISSSLDLQLLQKLQQKIISPQQLIFIGVNVQQQQDASLIHAHKLKLYSSKEMSTEGIHDVSDAAMASLRALNKNCYLSVNLNVLDKIFSPHGTVGGLTPRELIYLIQRFKLLKTLSAVELLGIDSSPYGLELAAKLVRELA